MRAIRYGGSTTSILPVTGHCFNPLCVQLDMVKISTGETSYECLCFNPLCVQLDMVRTKPVRRWLLMSPFQSAVRAIRYGA